MNAEKRKILDLLAAGRITADEAERLLVAVEEPTAAALGETAVAKPLPRYLRVDVDADGAASGPTKVNIRVPMSLLRAGVRLSSLLPPNAREQVNAAMARQGVPFGIDQLKPENLAILVEQLSDLQVDVDNQKAKVKIYCE